MNQFDGFPLAGLKFLQQLPKRDKAWFQAHRTTYEEMLATPAKTFVETLGTELKQSISSKINAAPRANGSIAPINNDVRFSKDKTPYKDHLLFRFWEGGNKKNAPTLYVRLSGQDVGFASGAMFENVEHWRRRVADDTTGKELAAIIKSLSKGRKLDVAGQALKRVPSPYAQDHPRAALLRHKMIQVRWAEKIPTSVNKSAFVAWSARRLILLTDMHQWLVRNL